MPIHGGAGVEMGVSLEFNYFKTCEATCKSEDRREWGCKPGDEAHEKNFMRVHHAKKKGGG